MIKTNYHTHSTYCDGKNTIEEMIKRAVEVGIEHIGISSHAPIAEESHWTMNESMLDRYFAEIEKLKNKYRDKIIIYAGMEIDYFYDQGLNPVMSAHMERLDYFIGSVHALGKVDGKKYWYVDDAYEGVINGVEKTFDGDSRKAVEKYYAILSKMIEDCKPDIVGHMDKIKKNNRDDILFNEEESWYIDAVKRFLAVAKKNGTVIEINTGGIRRYGIECFYPSYWILDIIRDMDVKVTVNGDSHDVEGVNFYYDETRKLLISKGIEYIYTFVEKEWIKTKF